MARKQSRTVENILEYQEEFRLLMAGHYMTLPKKKPFTAAGGRDSIKLCIDVYSDDGDHLNVIEARHPAVYAANLSLSFRNEPRLSVDCWKFDWVFEESDDEGVKFTNIGEGLITMATAGGAGLFFSIGEIKRKRSFQQLCSQIVRRLLDSRETVTYSLLNVDGNEMTDLLAGGNKIQFLKDKTGQFGPRNLLENRLTSQQQLEKVWEKFSNVSADEIIKFRLAGWEEGGEIYLVNLRLGDRREGSHSVLRDCLQARADCLLSPHSLTPCPTHLSSLTKLLARPLSPESGLITKIVVLGDIPASIHHQDLSLATIKYISGINSGKSGERQGGSLCEDNPATWSVEELEVWLQLSYDLYINQTDLPSGQELFKLTSSEFRKLFQSFKVLPDEEMRGLARRIRSDLWELYRSYREKELNKKLASKKKFVTSEGPKKSYVDILNGGLKDDEHEKLRAELGGISRRLFEADLNKEFDGNRSRYEKKNKEMMEMEWSNKVAASDRAEARLFPILNIDTSSNKNQSRRRKSIYD